MYPQDPADRDDDSAGGGGDGASPLPRQSSRSSDASSATTGSWEHVDPEDANPEASGRGAQEGAAAGGMVVSFPMDQEADEEEEAFWGDGDETRVREEKRKARKVAEARDRRAQEEEELIRGEEEAARRAGEAAREEELLRVREACLPGLVFMAHEVRFFVVVFGVCEEFDAGLTKSVVSRARRREVQKELR